MLRKRKIKRSASSLTGQPLQQFPKVAEIVNKAKATAGKIRNKVQETRPGIVVPPESPLLTPSGISVDHERILPQKLRKTDLSIDY